MNPIAELYALYGGRIRRYLLRLSGSHEVADDLTQETFARLLPAIVTYRGQAAVSTWLYGIARNVYREHVRRQIKEKRLVRRPPEDLPGYADSPEERLLRQEERATVQATLDLLSETDREILILKEYEAMGYLEIASLLGQSVNWARVTHFRAKQRFQQIYERLEEGGHD